jgi:aminomethyltransferase
MSNSKKTCLYDNHVALGALISPFGGFDMPIQYSNIKDEHLAVRQHVGIFDVSHMGEVEITGPDSEKFVQHIFTNDIAGAPAGKIFYGMMLYPTGGCVDDLLVYCEGEGKFFLVINAANIDKDVEWIMEQAKDFDVKVDHQSGYYGQIAVQGPESEQVITNELGLDVADLVFYTFKKLSVGNETIIVSRTGYTGEDGFEIYGSHAFVVNAWDKLIKAGVTPCGLGCRDTLRFEVGLPLYGDELSKDISPVMAGLGMFAKLDKEEFIGKEALAEQKQNGVKQKLVGIALADEDKAIPRHGYEVVNAEGEKIGEVTTGYRTIMTDKSVCFALVDAAYMKLGTELCVRIHRKLHKGAVVKKRFYDKSYKK